MQPTLSFPTTVEETTRGLSPWSELCSASAHDHCSEQNAVMLTTAPTKQEIGHELATTPPFPTPALTASSLSSTSFLGEHSPDLALTASANTMHNSFDHPYMTWRSRVKASDDLHLRSCLAQHNVGSMDHNLPTQQLSYCHGMAESARFLPPSAALRCRISKEGTQPIRSPLHLARLIHLRRRRLRQHPC